MVRGRHCAESAVHRGEPAAADEAGSPQGAAGRTRASVGSRAAQGSLLLLFVFILLLFIHSSFVKDLGSLLRSRNELVVLTVLLSMLVMWMLGPGVAAAFDATFVAWYGVATLAIFGVLRVLCCLVVVVF